MSEEPKKKEDDKPNIGRRDVVTALASIPVFGAFFAI